MDGLWLYRALSRWPRGSYRMKVMVMAFIGTHIPLLALIAYHAVSTAGDWTQALATIGVALLATLVGTAATLIVLHHLLRPVLMTARALRTYRERRDIAPLPTGYEDEVGVLMADASRTLVELDASLDALAYIDRASGLPNRDRLVLTVADRIERAVDHAVCVLRIANYDEVTTTFDSEVANALSRMLADRLAAGLGPSHRLSRVAPDAFALLVDEPAPDRWSAVTDLAAELQSAAERPVPLAGIAFRPVARVGVAIYPDDGTDAGTLIDHAVAAAARATAESAVVFHAPAAREAARERLKLEHDLRRALEEEQLVLHYQPVVDLAVGAVVGAEALLRWQHPERGLVYPGNFIAAAERSGLIDPIGLWVMRQACRQAGAWEREGLGKLKVAVNLSARQFLDRELVSLVRASLDLTGAEPDQLEIELTETVAMVDHDYSRRTFTALRDLGVSIAIDDFGTGYAGMSYLRKLPFDKLKIDREFVANVDSASDSQAICAALIELCRGLGLRVLAEGVERPEEVRHLRERGCRLFQGYYFGRPVPSDAFAPAIRDLTLPATAMRMGSGSGVPPAAARPA